MGQSVCVFLKRGICGIVIAPILFVAVSVFVMPALAVTSDGLIAYFPFKGNANDASFHGNHGSVHDAVLVSDRLGEPDSAYRFDGVNSYIDCGYNTELDLSSELTISAWIFSQQSEGFGRIVSRVGLSGSSTVKGYELIVGASHYPPLLQFNAGSMVVKSNNIVEYGKWIFVAVVCMERGVRLYVDGILTASSVIGSDLPRAGDVPLEIGNRGETHDHKFTGMIDEVRIYDRALSEEELSELYNEFDYPSSVKEYTKADLEVVRDSAYEAGRKICMENPASCGITVGEYSNFDTSKMVLHIPALTVDNNSDSPIWLDLELISQDPLIFKLEDYGAK
jgi:hypothetical protein